MSGNPSISDRFLPLLNDACDGVLIEAQRTELAAVLDSDVVARKVFIDHVSLQTDLRFLGRAERLCNVGLAGVRATLPQLPPSYPSPLGLSFATTFHGTIGYSSGWPVAYLIATVITGLCILSLWLMPVSRPDQIATHSLPWAAERQLAPEPLSASVGRITGLVDCRWGEGAGVRGQGSGAANLKSVVALGDKFALASGLMEITYDAGAKVILQGPVTYEVESNGGYLAVGKLTGKLEKNDECRMMNDELRTGMSDIHHSSFIIHPFSIRTPTATVTDLGTEFGVEVSPQRESQVLVFKGKVRLEGRTTVGPPRGESSLGAGNAAMVLEEGMGVRLDAEGRAQRFAVSEVKPLARTFTRRLSDPRTYMRTVLADKPLFYWTFDESDGPAFEQVRHFGGQALLPIGGAGRCSHAAIGSGLALGRAADFSQATGCFRSPLLGHGHMPGAWAIEFWVQATGDRRNHVGEYVMDAGFDSQFGPSNPGVIFNWAKDALKNELQLYYGGSGPTHGGPILADDRWHHVIFVFYGNDWGFGVAPRVDTVFDGRRKTIDRSGFTAGFNLVGRLIVGAAVGENMPFPFHGRIDELAFYDLSKLTVEQVGVRVDSLARRHLAAAKPGTTDEEISP